MNWKGIVIGGLVATILPFILAMCFVVIGLNNIILVLITFFIPLFIGSAIAGIKSIDKANAWKNGIVAIAFAVTIWLFMMYLMDYYLIHEPLLGLVVTIPIFLLIGAIGGVIGGKMKGRK